MRKLDKEFVCVVLYIALLVVILLLLAVTTTGCGKPNQSKDEDVVITEESIKTDAEVEYAAKDNLSEFMPSPYDTFKEGSVHERTSDVARGYYYKYNIDNCSKAEYDKYVAACLDAGFNYRTRNSDLGQECYVFEGFTSDRKYLVSVDIYNLSGNDTIYILFRKGK